MESYTTNPAAGVAIAFFWVVVIRGGRNPFVVESICTCADKSTTGADAAQPNQAAPFAPTAYFPRVKLKFALCLNLYSFAKLIRLNSVPFQEDRYFVDVYNY